MDRKLGQKLGQTLANAAPADPAAHLQLWSRRPGTPPPHAAGAALLGVLPRPAAAPELFALRHQSASSSCIDIAMAS